MSLSLCHGLADGVADLLFSLHGYLAANIVTDFALDRFDFGTTTVFGHFPVTGFANLIANRVFFFPIFGVVTRLENRVFHRANHGLTTWLHDRLDFIPVAGPANSLGRLFANGLITGDVPLFDLGVPDQLVAGPVLFAKAG